MLSGHTLKGRYRIYDHLGVGGAATAYLSRDSITGQMVVVKVVHPHLVNDDFIARFQREIDLLQQINSPYIIGLHDWALREYDEAINQTLNYIIIEFVEGHTLANVIDDRAPLAEKDALAITRQLALGLHEVHRLGIVHRDIKSQNIMVTPDQRVKLIDFGIAKGQNQLTITGPSQFTGTIYYAPPEQILEASSVDHRADIYSLGVVLYEMLMGHLPVRARELGTAASRIISGNIEPLQEVTDDVADLVLTMMAPKADNRLDTAMDVVHAIDQIESDAFDVAGLDDLPTPATTMIAQAVIQKEQANLGPQYALITESGQSIVLRGQQITVGRSHPSDPNVPDVDLWALGIEQARTASRRHCRIVITNDGAYVEDLGSMNGTFVNGAQLQPGSLQQLHDGDQLIVGRVVLTFNLG
ncbi:MAG: protein kinase [Chloroflexi bacterium]|nr:protein kinase [Chloroflexota bacterium]